MKILYLLKVLILAAIVPSFSQTSAKTANIKSSVRSSKNHDLLFVENKGQVTDASGNLRRDILFTAENAGVRLWFSASSIHYQFTRSALPALASDTFLSARKQGETEPGGDPEISTHRLSIQLLGSNLDPEIIKEDLNPFTSNYYLGYCPEGILNVKSYSKIIYKNVYPNIDWILYSKKGFMEYDFIVHPGGNTDKIQLQIVDANSVSLNPDGSVALKTSLGEICQKAPVSYVEGKKIKSSFTLSEDHVLGFSVHAPKNKELRIDPEIVWATYYGGSQPEWGDDCAVDPDGNVYLSGKTNSSTGIASGGFQNTKPSGDYNAFLVKFDAGGLRLWATYYGGGDFEAAYKCEVDGDGNVYLTGATSKTSGIASGGFQSTLGGGIDGYLVKFNPAGARLWGTYFGGSGSEVISGCGVDLDGNVFISGYTSSTSGISSTGFQNTHGGGFYDGYLAKLNSEGSLQWATYYGGSGSDGGSELATDSNGNVFLAGSTSSPNNIAFNGFLNTLDTALADGTVYVAKFNASGERLWGTYYPSGLPSSVGSAVDSNGNFILMSTTLLNSGVASGGFQNDYGGSLDSCLIKFDPSGNRLWATYLGGPSMDLVTCCISDSDDNIYITGWTTSTSGVAFEGFQNVQGGSDGESSDGFIYKLDADGNRLWSSYFGGESYDYGYGCAVDNIGNLYFAGQTFSSSNIAQGGFQNTANVNDNSSDAFLAKVNGSTLGTVNHSGLASLRVYPNPVAATLNIGHTDTIFYESYTVTDLNGKTLFTERGSSETTTQSINVSGLPAGTYFLNAHSGSHTVTVKFVRQ